ncbi:MAG: hypothetical protein K2Y30_01815 [Flavobacteriaceae bacterium]|nr:hypothetical protein [Flavobacteriaceae bacterium]
MSRITKLIAEATANELVKSKKQELAKQEAEFKKILEHEIAKEVPIAVLEFYKNYKHYVHKTKSVQISGNGWDFKTIYLEKEMPSYNGNKIQFTPKEKIATKLLSLHDEIESNKKVISKLQDDLESVIFNLRTYKSVQENFPEAFDLLPKIVNNAIQLNLSDIRNRIK